MMAIEIAIAIAIAIVVQCVKLYCVQRQRGWIGLGWVVCFYSSIHPYIEFRNCNHFTL